MRGLEFYGYHGVMSEERNIGQKFVVDVDIYLHIMKGGKTDDIRDTISYAEVYKVIKEFMEQKQYKLLEALAENIAEIILRDFDCKAVKIEVHKPHAPVPGIFEDISIEIYRENKL